MISNNDEWMGIPNLQWKSTIDAEIGHAHDHESSGVCKTWQGFTNFMRLSLHALLKRYPYKNPDRWIKDNVLHGIPSGWDSVARMLRKSPSSIRLGSYVFLSKSLHFWHHSFIFWAVSMSKVFGMHTTLYWLRGMHCWWRLTVNIVRRDGTLMNLSKCRERNWLEETDWYWTTVSCCLSVSGKQVDDWHLPLNACGGLCQRLLSFWHTNYAL